MTHDDASVETGVGGQAKYDMMMVFCGNALQKHHNTLKSGWGVKMSLKVMTSYLYVPLCSVYFISIYLLL